MNPSKRSVFIAILAFTLALAVIFWTFIPPTYLTNDDVAIKRDLEGLIAPDSLPTGYAVWPHALLGWAVVSAQRVVPFHGWDFVVAGLLIWSIAVGLNTAWSCSADRTARCLAVVAMLLAIVPLFDGMQYTISATLAGGTATLTLLTAAWLRALRRPVVVACAALLLAGLLVRGDSATIGGSIGIVLLVPLALSDPATRTFRVRWLIVAAVALLLTSTAADVLNAAIYRLSPPWAGYRSDWLETRQLLEWGGELPADVVSALRTRLGWTANDWELLRRFWGIDPNIHSQNRLDLLFHSWPSLVGWRTRLAWFAQRAVADMPVAMLLRLASESAGALAAGVLVVIAVANRRGAAASLVVAAIFYAACLAMEIAFKELPFRLFAPLQVCLVLAVLITSWTLNRRTSTRSTLVSAFVAAALLVAETRVVGSHAAARSRQSNEIEAQVSELLQLDPSLLVLHGDSFPSEFWWRPFHTPVVRLRAIQLGIENHNPYLQRFLARSYPPSLMHAACTDPSILVVSEADRLEPVTVYMREHFDTVVEWTKVYDASFRVWRCLPAAAIN